VFIDINVEQAREVFHAAHESLLAMIDHLQMPHAAVRQALKVSCSYGKLVDLCVWILFMWYHKLEVSCLVVFRNE